MKIKKSSYENNNRFLDLWYEFVKLPYTEIEPPENFLDDTSNECPYVRSFCAYLHKKMS